MLGAVLGFGNGTMNDVIALPSWSLHSRGGWTSHFTSLELSVPSCELFLGGWHWLFRPILVPRRATTNQTHTPSSHRQQLEGKPRCSPRPDEFGSPFLPQNFILIHYFSLNVKIIYDWGGIAIETPNHRTIIEATDFIRKPPSRWPYWLQRCVFL